MTKLTELLNLSIESMAEAAARDLHAICTSGDPEGGLSMPDMTWLLVRTVTTGKQVGGLILDAEELSDARQKMSRFLDIAIAGGWRGIDLLETLIAKGVVSERLEGLARKAGGYCNNRPDLLDELFREIFGEDVSECIAHVPCTAPTPEALQPVKPAVELRNPMDQHFRLIKVDGEEHYVMSPEATLLVAAQSGYDPSEAVDCADGGIKARAVVDSVLMRAAQVGYSRQEALRTMLTTGPYGRETLAAIEHLTGECGFDVIVRGMSEAGFRFGGRD
jgi:hypothetical protein